MVAVLKVVFHTLIWLVTILIVDNLIGKIWNKLSLTRFGLKKA